VSNELRNARTSHPCEHGAGFLHRADHAERELPANGHAGLMRMVARFGDLTWMTADKRATYLQGWSEPGALTGMLNWYRASPLVVPKVGQTVDMAKVPRLDPAQATRLVKETLEKDPPYGARVTFEGEKSSTGWDAPPLSPWLARAVERASQACFGKPPMAFGEGGTIPFMGMLGEKFPQAQFLITGVLGPGSNAHGPNEFLHIPTGVRLTACVASVAASASIGSSGLSRRARPVNSRRRPRPGPGASIRCGTATTRR